MRSSQVYLQLEGGYDLNIQRIYLFYIEKMEHSVRLLLNPIIFEYLLVIIIRICCFSSEFFFSLSQIIRSEDLQISDRTSNKFFVMIRYLWIEKFSVFYDLCELIDSQNAFILIIVWESNLAKYNTLNMIPFIEYNTLEDPQYFLHYFK